MKLYRYRGMTSKDLARTFTHCELYFTSPTQFNDPFDCNPPFSITDYSENDLRDYTQETFRRNFPGISDPELKGKTEKSVASILRNYSSVSHFAEHFNRICLEVNSEIGVLCLSEKPDDILMWSHYGDCHRGIVLQFDKSELNKSGFNYCQKVDYENNIVTLKDMNINRTNPLKLAELVLLKKAAHWKYEEEWRIIVDPSLNDIPGCRIYKFPKEVLTGVIFGCKMAPEDKNAVHTWLKAGNHQALIYQAIRETSAYSLKIDPPL